MCNQDFMECDPVLWNVDDLLESHLGLLKIQICESKKDLIHHNPQKWCLRIFMCRNYSRWSCTCVRLRTIVKALEFNSSRFTHSCFVLLSCLTLSCSVLVFEMWMTRATLREKVSSMYKNCSKTWYLKNGEYSFMPSVGLPCCWGAHAHSNSCMFSNKKLNKEKKN